MLKPNSFSAEQSTTAQWLLGVTLLHLHFSKSKCEFTNVCKNSNLCEVQTTANLQFYVINYFKTVTDYLESQKSLSKLMLR